MQEGGREAGSYNVNEPLVNRLLKLINLLIAVAALTALAATYWFVWRVLPQTSGTVALPVRAAATIARDAQGVAHIRAGSLEDAVFLQGYVTAQDRLWHMDMARRKASGEIAELVGAAALPGDRVARLLQLRRIAEEQLRTLPPAERNVLAAYARGVNEFIRTHAGALPVEFTILGYGPRPWTMADSLAVGMEMQRTLSQSHEAELRKSQMLSGGGGDADKIRQLFPVRMGAEPALGSNAWVISGAHTASGKPLLANDTHLEFTFPSTWYQVHVQAPGLNVTGFSLPGVPLVIIGHNESIAWGVTNLHFDVMDLFAERMDAAGRYEYQAKVELARSNREVIAVQGARPEPVTQFATRHGFTLGTDNGRTIALQWSAAATGFRYIFADLNRARDWREFRDALSRYPGPAQNFIYADTAGNIGYQAAGRLPLRDARCDSSLPLDGATGACEWLGLIPFDDLPSIYNPPSGRIVTANQNPFPRDYQHPVAGRFAPPYRARQIEDRLRAKAKHSAADMLSIQKDVYSPFHHFLARELARAGGKRVSDGRVGEAVKLLTAWNGTMEQGLAAPVIAQMAFEQLRRDIAERAAPGKSSLYESEVATAVVERLLRERPADWFKDYDELLLRALAEALQAGVRQHGPKLEGWDYARHPQPFMLPHPVLSRLPVIGQYFKIGPVPMAGASTTVKQHGLRTNGWVGPSMRFVADLGDWERSQANVTIGQSGQALSKHFSDQWESHYVGKSFPQAFAKVNAAATLQVTPR
jgi:penicillin G amidase